MTTHYQELLDTVDANREYQNELITTMDEVDSIQNKVWQASDLAGDAVFLAQAEQQRIANLIALANTRGYDWLLTSARREGLIEEAMRSLGIRS